MSKIWEAFENLQEIVYVVDAKEYDLVYMNQLARSTFNCSRTEDYRGRKCYELLQGLPEPCRFCSDARGKGTYALKETLIEQTGEIAARTRIRHVVTLRVDAVGEFRIAV